MRVWHFLRAWRFLSVCGVSVFVFVLGVACSEVPAPVSLSRASPVVSSVVSPVPVRAGDHALDALRQLAVQPDDACANSTIPVVSTASDTTDITDKPDMKPAAVAQQNWIVGYGSLMQQASRTRSAPLAGSAQAVEVRGFRRGWFTHGSRVGFSTTFLGAVPDPASGFNAVVFSVTPEELRAMDQRESGYCRRSIAADQLTLLTPGAVLPAGAYWMYVNTPDTLGLAHAGMPLVQSYIDVFLSGCLEQEEGAHLPGFAARCIQSTSDWSAHWVNDRIYPRRPFIYQPQAGKMDRLLAHELPELFRRIRLE